MDGPLGIALAALVVVGLCVQLAIALRNRYVSVSDDAERDVGDAEKFEEELELQLQGELDEAIKSSTPAEGSLVDVSVQNSTRQVHFDTTADESSWTTFKRESRAKLSLLAKTLNLVSDDNAKVDETSLDAPHGHIKPQMAELRHHQRSVRRQLPLLDSDGALAERQVLVNAKQYSRILKRRYARQLIEDYFRSQPTTKTHSPRVAGSLRKPRGLGGRFLTAEEVRVMEAGPLVNGTAA